MKHNRTSDITPLGTNLRVSKLADVEIQRRIQPRAAAGDIEFHDGELRDLEDLGDVSDEVIGRRGGAGAVGYVI